jgi:hypothetical protein
MVIGVGRPMSNEANGDGTYLHGAGLKWMRTHVHEAHSVGQRNLVIIYLTFDSVIVIVYIVVLAALLTEQIAEHATSLYLGGQSLDWWRALGRPYLIPHNSTSLRRISCYSQ